MTVTRERADYIEYTLAAVEDIISLTVARAPNSYSTVAHIHLMVFATEFTLEVWIMIAFVSVTSAVAFAAISSHTTNKDALDSAVINGGVILGVNSLFFLTLQRRLTLPRSDACCSFKLFYLTTTAFCFVLSTLYVAKLTSTMTAGGGQTRVSSFREVLERRDFTVYTTRGSVFEHFFMLAPEDSVVGRVYSKQVVALTHEEMVDVLSRTRAMSNVGLFGWGFMAVTDRELLHLTDFEDAHSRQVSLHIHAIKTLTYCVRMFTDRVWTPEEF